MSSIRLVVALAVEHNMSIKQFDVETAYLNGVIEEEVHMETPNFLAESLKRILQDESNICEIGLKAKNMLEDLKTGNKVCLLQKSIYGLQQTGRN